jgi:hypothetical protein
LRLRLGGGGALGLRQVPAADAERLGVIHQVLDAGLGRFLEIEVVAAGVANVEWPQDFGEEIERGVTIPGRDNMNALG